MTSSSSTAIESVWIGEPAPRALVFLHEGLGSLAQWRDLPAAIARATGLPAFIYSRQGYGRSAPVRVPRPLSYMHDEAAALPAILGDITEPILVGHSDGASIAIIAAGEGHVAPRALVLIAPHVFVEDISVQSIAAAREAYEHGDLRARLAKYHADVDGAFWGWNGAWLDPGFRSWNLEAYLPRITAPALIVQGTADQYGTLRRSARSSASSPVRSRRCWSRAPATRRSVMPPTPSRRESLSSSRRGSLSCSSYPHEE